MSRTPAFILTAVLLVVSASALQAQSLAEAAQKEAARRKEVKGTARVITNKDLPNVPTATATIATPDQATTPAASPSNSASAPRQDAAQDDQTPKDGGTDKRDEKYWRDRLAKAKAQVEQDQILVDALQSRVNGLTTDFVNRDDPAQRAAIANDRERAVAELARLKKAIVDGVATVAGIEEEARRAGVHPWRLR